jgi:hypothetical protein
LAGAALAAGPLIVAAVVAMVLVAAALVGVPFAATAAGAAFGADFATTGAFEETFTPALGAEAVTIVVLVVAAGFEVVAGLEAGFVVPLPLFLAVALLTGASRETVLEPARLALAEVTFGIAHRFY